ncbi:hypothetical protein Pmani_000791 [Petrolisthes manimaculis]|uniref:non-specific serine/threonine protein kinase n=1 Tax=Petrolisthes manimaculis TaxID=1843537 RepID=A0AAE1UM00_9EUCA|nr:hypothetical protein Pmani_000791 [Petrolisthes manimaculis]
MVRLRSYAKSYQKKNEEPRPRHRRIIPNFSELYVKKGENNKPSKTSNKPTKDILDFSALTLDDKTENVSIDKSKRKPLGVSSCFTNSSIESTSYISFNDTFDQITKGTRQPRSAFGLTCTSSTSGTSFVDVSSGILFKSLGTSLDSIAEQGQVEHSSSGELQLKLPAPIPSTRVKNRQRLQAKHERITRCRQNLKKIEEAPLPIKQASSPQLFNSGDDRLFEDWGDQEEMERVSGKYLLGNKKYCKVKKKNISPKAHSHLPTNTDKGRNDKPLPGDETHETGTKNSTEIADSPINSSLHPSPWVKKLLNRIGAITPSMQKCLPQDLKTPPKIENNNEDKQCSSKKELASPASFSYQKSDPTSHLDRLKSFKDILPYTSTPTEKSRINSVLRKKSHLSSPSLEHSLSPVHYQTSMVVEECSSVFESPVSSKELCKSSLHGCTCSSSHGSKYVTCMSSTKKSCIVNQVEENPAANNKHVNSCERFQATSRSIYDSEVKLDHKLLKNQTGHTTDSATSVSPLSATEKLSCRAGVVSPVPDRKKKIELQRSELAKVSLNTEKNSNDKFASPCLNSLNNSGQISMQENLNFQETNDSRAGKFSEAEESVILDRKIVRRQKTIALQDVISQSPILTRKQRKAKLAATGNSFNFSSDSRILPKSYSKHSRKNNDNSIELAESLMSNTSQFSPIKCSPIISRIRRRTKHILENTNLSSVSEKYSPSHLKKPIILTGKIAPRKSRRLSSKAYITTRPSKKFVRNRDKKLSIWELSDISLGINGEKCPSLPSSIRRSKSSAKVMGINRNQSTVCSDNEKESESPGEGFECDSRQNDYESSEFGNLNKDPVQLAQDLKNCGENMIEEPSSSSPIKQESLHSTVQNKADLSLELEAEQQFQHSFTTLVKPGKNWRRSLRSMALLQASSADPDLARACEHLKRFQANYKRKTIGLRVSVIPPDISKKIQEIKYIRELHNQSGLQVTFLNDHGIDQDLSLMVDPRERVLFMCSQVEPLPLTECFTESRLACCKKIGEGVYGEVFMTRPNHTSLEDATVLKIMPIEGDFDVNGEPQKKFHEIMSEIITSRELSNLRNSDQSKNWTENFVHMLNCWCIQGRYHQDLLQLWDQYHEEKGSENDRPDVFPDEQLYIVLEFGHCGSDLESYIFNNARDAKAVFLQIAYSLAVAEQQCEFEHRDLHWGNILVASTCETEFSFNVDGETYTLKTHGLKATVIDFTLSRLKTKHCVVYNNLALDPSLFTAEGDYQFEIYRQMKKANKNEWETFTPYTNVLWLHYLLDKMLTQCYYKNSKSKIHTKHRAELAQLKEMMLGYESATHFVLSRELEYIP